MAAVPANPATETGKREHIDTGTAIEPISTGSSNQPHLKEINQHADRKVFGKSPGQH